MRAPGRGGGIARRWAWACLAVLTACGGSVQRETARDSGANGEGGMSPFQPSPDSGAPMDAGTPFEAPDVFVPPSTFAAPHPPMPQVQDYGGPLILTPTLVAITYASDSSGMVPQIEDFVSKVGGTDYWIANAGSYGAGAATSGSPIHVSDAAPTQIDDSGIQAWLSQKFGSDPDFGTPDPNTVYAIFYPPGTTVTFQNGTSCQDFAGYHNQAQVPGGVVTYAVIPRCASLGKLTGLDVVTGAASHEFLEAITDPLPDSNPAYAQIDSNHFAWALVVGGGEVADMCAQNPEAFYRPVGFDYTVQRSWSNELAAGSHDPCAPAPGAPYFNSAPVLTDDVTLVVQGQDVPTLGARIPVGGTKTVELDLYSDAPTTGPWSVSAKDVATLLGMQPELAFTFDNTSGQNGDHLHMTIQVLRQGSSGAEGFLVINRLSSQTTFWVGVVTNN